MNPSPRSEAETETRGVNKFVASGVDPRFLLTPKRNDSGNTLSLAPAPSPLQSRLRAKYQPLPVKTGPFIERELFRVQPPAPGRERSQGAPLGDGQGSAAPSPASFGKPPLVETAGWEGAPGLAETFPPPAGSGRRRPSCRSISSQAAMVSRSCRCRCSTASSSCWARSSRGGCGGGLPPSPSPAFPRSTPAASRSPSILLGVAVPLSCPARRWGRASRTGS